jgi:hypothetical protein
MRKWSEFGEQVNRLVYALAGRKYQADIEMANRVIAERIYYSEVSLRMMRQGRFRPREPHALEILVEIGKLDAELGRDWAVRLLHSGQHPDPKPIIQRLFPPDENSGYLIISQPESTIMPRLAGTFVGTFAMLLLWTYGINPAYPAPHELSWVKELLWGLLIGLGLAAGLAGADFWSAKRNGSPTQWFWPGYLTLPLSAVFGALIWNTTATIFFIQNLSSQIISTCAETINFGAIYGLTFSVAVLLVRRKHCDRHRNWKPWQIALLFIMACAGAALTGFLLAVLQPSFATQKDIDMAVGVLVRAALIFLVSIFFPAE